jgi:SAM-dependent methyltransferase
MSPRRKREWFDDDGFWRDLYPFIFPETRFEAAVVDTPRLIRLARPRGRAVLDLACGPGRFSIAFAKRKYRVTGVDRTRYLLDRARARAKTAKVQVEWVREDMRDFVRPDAFDLALSLFTSFGYFEDKSEDVRVLRQVLESLRPGGALVVEVLGKEQIAGIFAPASADTVGDTLLVQRREIFDDWTRIRNEWTLVRGGRAKTYAFSHTIYSGQELRERFEQAGYSKVKLYGNFEGEPYSRRSPRLVAVGWKG